MVGVLETALRVSVIVFMLGSLFGVGLAATPRAVLAPLQHGRFVVLTLVIGWVVCPLVARVLLGLVPLDRPYAVALVLLSLAPAAPFAPGMMRIARADAAHIAAFMVLVAIATVAFMPVAVPLLVDGVSAEPLVIARPLVMFVLLPVLVGLATRQFDRDFADKAQRPIAAMTNITGLALLVLIGVLYGRGVLDAVGSYAIALQIVFVGVVTLLAHGLGRGLPDEQGSVLTLGMCSRNLGVTLAALTGIEPDPRAIVMVAIAAPVTLVISALTARWIARAEPPDVTRGVSGDPTAHRKEVRAKAAETA